MIVNNIQNIQTNIKKVNFKGMESIKTPKGHQSYDFFLPYDQKKYKAASIEFVQLKKSGTDFVVDTDIPTITEPLDKDGRITISPAKIVVGDQPFGYRFNLEKYEGGSDYVTDSGLRTENTDKTPGYTKYVVVLPNRAPITNPGGSIIHLVPDSHNPGYEMKDGELVYERKDGEIVLDKYGEKKPLKNETLVKKALAGKRNHFNQYGGNIAGIIADIPRLVKYGYDFILSTPIFGADERSSHGYWTSNPFQMTKKNGTLEDFKTLNVESFKQGMSLIADGAFVNEGMEGYRLGHVFKWGKESPYYNNFRITDNPTIENLPNVDPNSTEGKEIYSHIKLNIVNGNKKYSCDKDDISEATQTRDPKKLTYIQIYDDRLISAEQKKQISNGELIDASLSNHTTGNHYEISNNRQSVLLRNFVIPEDEVEAFEKRLQENKKLYSENRLAFLQTVLTFKNFNIGTQANGFETWDGNADIAKLRYIYSMADEQNLDLLGMSKAEKLEVQQGAFQNQDQLQKIGMYWTKITNDALLEHSAKTLKNESGAIGYRDILKDSKGQLPPKSAEAMSDEVIENVIGKKYLIPQLYTTDNAKDRLTEDLMNLPLESIGFSSDVTAVLGSPFISKKAFREEDISKTRYEFYQEKAYRHLPDRYQDIYSDADEFYTNGEKSLVEFAHDIISKADTDGKLIDKETQKLTDAGKLILPLVANDILKFAMVKSLAPDVKVENKNGKLVYDEKALGDVNLKNIGGVGISAKSPEDEARQTLNLLKNGLVNISEIDKELLAKNIQSRFQKVKEDDIKMAYVLVDRTASGLNWRTDATKDTGPMGEVRDGLENFGPVMDASVKIWQRFFDGIKKVNPNSYNIAEMTDTDELMKLTGGVSGRHKDNMGLERAFVHESGASGLSNYMYFFSGIMDLVSTRSDSGKKDGPSNIGDLRKDLIGTNEGWSINKGFLFSYPQDGIKTSHNFTTNHDKPRLLSILALDNKLFHGKKDANELQGYKNFYTPNAKTPSYPALAMAKAIDSPICEAIQEMGLPQDAKNKIQAVIKDLAQGEFQGKKFNPEAFGVSPIDFAIKDVILQAEFKHGLKLEEKREELFNKTFDKILTPALEKMLLIDKFMAIMPGRNTSYSGDEYGATGYETPNKNIHSENRNVANRSYIDIIKSIGDYYKNKQEVNLIRRKSGLSALSKGETAMLNSGESDILAMFRYDKVSELICLAHTRNVNPSEGFTVGSSAETTIDKIDLSPQYKDGTVVAGLAGGLAVGTYFKDARKNAINDVVDEVYIKDELKKGVEPVYGVCKEAGKYIIKKFQNLKGFETYLTHRHFGKDYDLTDSHKISIPDNIMILKKAGKIVHRPVFGGNQNQNHIKIQAYLSSKQSLNINKRNAI